MKEIKLKDINPLEDIKQKLRVAHDHSHLLANNSDSMYLLLYLLILKKDGYLKGLGKESKALVVDLIKERIDKCLSDDIPIKRSMHTNLSDYFYNVKDDGLYNIIELFDSFDKVIFNAHFSEIFDDLLYRMATTQGPYAGEFIQPFELTRFLNYLIGEKNGQSVYNPFAGLASFNVLLPNSTEYYGQEINKKIWSIGAMRICAYGNDGNSMFMPEDSINNWNPLNKLFDVIIANPPFKNNTDQLDSIESFIIKNSLKNLKDDGKLILVVPNGFLFRANKDKLTRQQLIEDDLLEAVFSFPGGLLFNTAIPFSVIVLNKAKKNKGIVKFIDAKGFVGLTSRKVPKIQDYALFSIYNQNKESEFIKDITYNEIDVQDYSLNANRYFIKKFDGIQLNSFLSTSKSSKSFDNSLGIEVKIGDLKSDIINYSLDAKNINVVELQKNCNKIENSCLLISSKGKNLKPTFFSYRNVPIFITNDVFAFYVNEKLIRIDYLIIQLSSDYFTEQLESIQSGSTIQFIKREDFLKLLIKLPSLEEQSNIVANFNSEYKRSKIREFGLEQEIEKTKQQQKEDLSIKKHNIMQHLNNVKSAADLLFKTAQKNQGTINLDNVIDERNNIKTGDIFKEMINSISNVLFYVDNLTNDFTFNKSEEVDLRELIEKSITKVKGNVTDKYKIDFSVDKASFIVPAFDLPEGIDEVAPIVEFSSIDFYELFNNVLENAVKHGFTETTRIYTFRIRLTADLGNGSLIVTFSNNGNPFPLGMAERYALKGEKAGKTANKGIGSWKVNQVAKHFKSEIKVYDFLEEEFPVKIDLIIPLKSIGKI